MVYNPPQRHEQIDYQSAYNYLKGSCEMVIPMLIKSQESSIASAIRNSVAEAEKLKVPIRMIPDEPVYRGSKDVILPPDTEHDRKGIY